MEHKTSTSDNLLQLIAANITAHISYTAIDADCQNDHKHLVQRTLFQDNPRVSQGTRMSRPLWILM